MGVADDVAVLSKSLWRRVIGSIRVGEASGIEVGDLDFNIESCIGCNVLVVLGVDEDSPDHVILAGNFTHDCGKVNDFPLEGLLGNIPIPLQDPPLTCSPLVRVFPAQKLMKLLASLDHVSHHGKQCGYYTDVAESD